MGILHDKIADKVSTYLIKSKAFGNRYISSNLPIFPRPDVLLLGLSKKPLPQIALEVKPPHAVKREYLTGLGQAIAYLIKFPLVFLVLPDETIDGLHIPSFLIEIIEKSELKIGVISYDLNNYFPKIEKDAIKEDKIDIKNLEIELNNFKPRSWLFWMDTKLKEVGKILEKIVEVENRKTHDNIKSIVLDEIWDEVLSKRFSGSSKPSSYKLNYKLLFDTLNLWTGKGQLTILGNRLYELNKIYGINSDEFKDGFHYTILTEGGYLKMLILIDKLQNQKYFTQKGSKKELNELIKEIRKELKIEKRDYERERDEVLLIYKKKANNCWLKEIGTSLFEMGYGRSLTQLNEEITRRFGPTFQNSLKTKFYINRRFKKKKGYIINWERIIDLIHIGEKNLDLF